MQMPTLNVPRRSAPSRATGQLLRLTLGLLLLVATLFTTATVSADKGNDKSNRIPVLDAADTESIKQHLGDTVIVRGVVERAAWSRSGKVLNITFKNGTDQSFAAAIFSQTREAFDEAFDGDVSEALAGARVRLSGRVQEYGGRAERYKGRPEIILRDPTQITILKPAKDADDDATTQPGDEDDKDDKSDA